MAETKIQYQEQNKIEDISKKVYQKRKRDGKWEKKKSNLSGSTQDVQNLTRISERENKREEINEEKYKG